MLQDNSNVTCQNTRGAVLSILLTTLQARGLTTRRPESSSAAFQMPTSSRNLTVNVKLFNHNHYLCLFLWEKGGRRDRENKSSVQHGLPSFSCDPHLACLLFSPKYSQSLNVGFCLLSQGLRWEKRSSIFLLNTASD